MDNQVLLGYCEGLKSRINFLEREIFDLRREVADLKERLDPPRSITAPSSYDLTQGNKGFKGLKK